MKIKLDPNVVRTGDRLKDERKRLGKTQLQFAEIGQITRQTQQLYETADRFPSYEYLVRLSQHDVDVIYVMTGLRNLEPSSSNLDNTRGDYLIAELKETNEAYRTLSDQLYSSNARHSELVAELEAHISSGSLKEG